MSVELEGKVVLVTGAGRGIGRAIALELASHGAKVVVNDLGVSTKGEDDDQTVAETVVDEIRKAGGEAIASGASVSTWDGANEMVGEAMKTFGRLDAVVNNAGILRDRMFHNMDPEEWRAVIDVHLSGTWYVSRAAAPIFRSNNKGAYVHFTSTAGLIGTVGQTNYGAAKAGIAGLSKQIALDMERFNVRSNCVSPWAWTRMIDAIRVDTPEQEERVRKLQAMSPDKIAPLVAFLVSDAAAAVNGQIFGMRNNEVFLMSQSRPLRSMQRTQGWKANDFAEHMLPAFSSSLYGLETSTTVFNWDPV
ncbi:SDR family oxidoreductase [Phenylobacterium sp.]|uniref:SDR family oxidoreductase n=1 Tax=Phenylobacterium sp. TaxID=1871053 RepID=UPI00301BE0C9